MGGITLDDFTSSVAYKEIFGLGLEEGRQEGRQAGRQEGRQEGLHEGRAEGRQAEAAALALRQLQRRCGPLSAEQEARIQALPLADLEALAEALLDFQGALHHLLQNHRFLRCSACKPMVRLAGLLDGLGQVSMSLDISLSWRSLRACVQ
ncbi:MAG: DUF4351 domain-containing protein [Cyanobium sp.]